MDKLLPRSELSSLRETRSAPESSALQHLLHSPPGRLKLAASVPDAVVTRSRTLRAQLLASSWLRAVLHWPAAKPGCEYEPASLSAAYQRNKHHFLRHCVPRLRPFSSQISWAMSCRRWCDSPGPIRSHMTTLCWPHCRRADGPLKDPREGQTLLHRILVPGAALASLLVAATRRGYSRNSFIVLFFLVLLTDWRKLVIAHIAAAISVPGSPWWSTAARLCAHSDWRKSLQVFHRADRC